ncbi:hypothetical protein [Nocardioides sp.]|uniref:hypothetical protein n=1 Tax=Nocardioides sp. TaxID=35761 RepID=UPI002718701E|nr:hypothetical protein [Nocardioides sp.]MDO9454977.1 hypothetical protein [Nocardioides sp.]
MAAEPVSGAEPDELAALRAERDDLEQRALEAEAIAEQLAEQLADAQRRLAADDPTELTLFDGVTPAGRTGRLAPDGSDQAVLPITLAAIAVVAFLVGVVSVVAKGPTLLCLVAFVAAGGLAWAAVQVRVTRVSIDVIDGVVRVVEGDSTRTFDLANDSVKVDVQGRPGDAYWRVRFYRRALDPVDVDDSMVDPADFMARLREHRPGL